jgi:hypothetical protein
MERFSRPAVALIIDWVPEQGEDIYSILLDSERIAVIEIPRSSCLDVDSISEAVVTVSDYTKRNLSTACRQKLDAALELIGELQY